MADAVSARASAGPAGPTETLHFTPHDALMDITEHLRETGDFNERAYIAMCDVAKEAHTLRDDTLIEFNRQLKSYREQLEALRESRDEVRELVDKQVAVAKQMMDRAMVIKEEAMCQIAQASAAVDEAYARVVPYMRAVDQALPYHVKLQRLVSAIHKRPARPARPAGAAGARRLRSGRRF